MDEEEYSEHLANVDGAILAYSMVLKVLLKQQPDVVDQLRHMMDHLENDESIQGLSAAQRQSMQREVSGLLKAILGPDKTAPK